MSAVGTRPWIGQVILSLALALIFSVLPLIAALTVDKSSYALAVLTAWYPLIPPLVILLIAGFAYRHEANWVRLFGRAWIAVGFWFGLQYSLSLLFGGSILLKLLALPATLAGGKGFLPGTLLFLIGGALLPVAGGRAQDRLPIRPMDGWMAGILLVLVLVGLAGFVLMTINPPGAISPAEELIPTEDQIFQWIREVYDLGVRRPGSVGTKRSIVYVQNRLRELGFEDVQVERSSFDYWEPVRWGLTLHPDTRDAVDLPCFYVPYSGPTPPGGVTAQLLYVGDIEEPQLEGVDVAGKALLVDIPPTEISWDQMKLFSFMAFDPQRTALGWSHPYPIGWMLKYLTFYEQVAEMDPAAIIGIMEGYPELGHFTYYAPYDGQLRPIPSLYVREPEGEQLKAAVAGGPATVRVKLEAKVEEGGGESANVYGVLPGLSPTTLIIHSHHDSPWRSGVEDSSGVGMVLALAKYYAQVPVEQRPRTMVFLFTGGHFVGGKPNLDFIARHKDDILARTLFDIVIEHIADDYNPPLSPTGMVEPRGTFISENPVAVSLYAGAVARHGIYRTLLFPTGTPLGVPTDGGQYHQAGVPVVSLISGPTWLFDDNDTLDRVARDQLVPLTRMYVDFIGRLNALPDWVLRFNLNIAAIGLTAVVLSPLTVWALSKPK